MIDLPESYEKSSDDEANLFDDPAYSNGYTEGRKAGLKEAVELCKKVGERYIELPSRVSQADELARDITAKMVAEAAKAYIDAYGGNNIRIPSAYSTDYLREAIENQLREALKASEVEDDTKTR